MPTPTLTTTAGDAAANSYCSLEDAEAYFDGRWLADEWADLTEDEQTRLLLSAMRLLEAQRFIGDRASRVQALHWPRVAIRPNERYSKARITTGFETLSNTSGGLYDGKGRFWASNVVPPPVKNAQCEIALAMLQMDSFSDEGMRRSQLRTQGLTKDFQRTPGSLPGGALEALQGLLLASGASSLQLT